MATLVADISEVEIARRRQAVRAADASVRLEGMPLSSRLTSLNEEFVSGRIDADELKRTVLGWHGLTQR